MITDLAIEIPHHCSPGCTLVVYTPHPSGQIIGRRAAWICRDTSSAYEAILWLTRVATNPDYRVSIAMTDRYELVGGHNRQDYAVGLWMRSIFRRQGEIPSGLRDLMEAAHLTDDPYLLPLVL